MRLCLDNGLWRVIPLDLSASALTRHDKARLHDLGELALIKRDSIVFEGARDLHTLALGDLDQLKQFVRRCAAELGLLGALLHVAVGADVFENEDQTS